MKLTNLICCLAVLGIFTLPSLRAQNAGIGGGQSGSQGEGGNQPPPSTAETPAGAAEKGVPPGTAVPTNSAANIPAGKNPSQMDTIVVTGAEGSILPTDQTVTSVFGTDLSVQDTPRAVTAISSTELQEANISTLADFVKIAPSSYTTDQFGIASVPNIRGQDAEVYINGMQRTTRGDGPPTSFNSVQGVNLVEGPSPAYLGPTAYTGGYVDLITKQPYFDAFHDDTEFTYGSYDEKMWTEDFGAPIIKNELAYRVSYQGDYSNSYYNNEKTNSNDGYIALAWTPSSDFRVDFNSEIYDGRFDENTGWNRPTQGLIDTHSYVTGTTSTSLFGGGPYPGGTYRGVIDPTGTTHLSPQSTLVSPDDSDFGKDINAELKETYNLNPDMTFINHTYYEYFELRNTELAQLYVNQPTSNIVQDRAEFHWNFNIPLGGAPAPEPKDMKDMKHMSEISAPLELKNEIVTGIATKYINAKSYGDFFNEYLNATDLSTNTYPTINNQAGGRASGALGPSDTNWSSSSPTQGFPNTFTETAYEISPFFEHTITFNKLSLLYSGRADILYDDLSDPVPIGDQGVHDTTYQVVPTADVSLTYKVIPSITTYLTFDWNESTAGNGAGGLDTDSNGGESADYHYQNFLYEGGVKADLLDHTLFTAVDGYYQTHNTTTALGATSEIRTFGAEISTTHQPDKHLSMVFNESYMHAEVINPSGQFTQNVYDAFSANSPYVNGTGNGSPNFDPLPTGDYRESGLPQFTFSGLATYTWDCGIGVSAGYQITDPIPTSELGNVWIPWQYEIDASINYTHKNFFARLNLYNITNQYNFSTGGYISTSGNDLITIHEPFHFEGTVGYKF